MVGERSSNSTSTVRSQKPSLRFFEKLGSLRAVVINLAWKWSRSYGGAQNSDVLVPDCCACFEVHSSLRSLHEYVAETCCVLPFYRMHMLAPLSPFAGDVAVACVLLFLRMHSPLSFR